MSVQVTLCVFLLFSSAASIICPAFDCDTLDSNVCASEISDDNFKINANGCETGYSCKGTIVLLWSEKEIYETNTTLFCEPGSSFSTLNSFYPKTYQESCLAHDPNKMFKNGGGLSNRVLRTSTVNLLTAHTPSVCALSNPTTLGFAYLVSN